MHAGATLTAMDEYRGRGKCAVSTGVHVPQSPTVTATATPADAPSSARTGKVAQ